MSSFTSDQGPISSIFAPVMSSPFIRLSYIDSRCYHNTFLIYSGIFPCFFAGFLSLLVSSISKA